ncbi:MAG: radical SAM protein [Bacteroidales bacterium]|nr:radical SAM protein [Bacteroidales bacterium]
MALTNICNHRCIFCQYYKNIAKPIKMHKEKGYLFLDQAFNLGVREVSFALIDEPFMSKDLEDYVVYAKNKGLDYVWLNTNGALASKDRIEKLFINGLKSIKFSVNAGKRETYIKVHGKDDFGVVIENINNALKIRDDLAVDVGVFVSFAENSINHGEGYLLENILKDKVDKIYIVSAVNQGGGMYEEVQKGLIKNDEMLWSRYKDDKDGKSILTKKICPYPFKRINITAEGYFTACCADPKNELVVANLNTTSLASAWNCDAIKKLREWHISGNMPENCKCYNCINNTDNAVKPLLELI